MQTDARRRPALDGLRALATLSVIVAHAEVPFTTGAGALGVTLFFVLSGFLITQLLVSERARTGRIDLRAFYLRRVRRLVPPLVLMLSAVSAILYVSGEPLWGVLSALTFTTDLQAFTGVTLHLVGHTWSLSLEEQFYAVWPVLLIVIGRRRPRLLIALVSIGAVLVTANRIVLDLRDVSFIRSYYGPDTRSDALMVGCLLALLLPRLRTAFRFGRWAALSGVVLLALFPSHREEQVFLLVPATLCAAAVVAWAWTTTDGGVLAWGPVRGFGRISYTVFLWHLPVTELFLNLGLNPWFNAVSTTSVCTLVALASWRWVESPMLSRRASQPPRQPAAITAPELELLPPPHVPAAELATSTAGSSPTAA